MTGVDSSTPAYCFEALAHGIKPKHLRREGCRYGEAVVSAITPQLVLRPSSDYAEITGEIVDHVRTLTLVTALVGIEMLTEGEDLVEFDEASSPKGTYAINGRVG